MLFWQALIGAKQDGCMQYEIGEVFPGVLDGKLRGLTVFKEKFDGELYPYYRAEIRLFDLAPKYIRLAAILPRPIRKLLKSLTI
jgi:lipid II:glycine glycyltransferase (peptidoglycan interpeptide bridge formation enzyme)